MYVLAGVVLGHHVLGLHADHPPARVFDDVVGPFRAALAEPVRRHDRQ